MVYESVGFRSGSGLFLNRKQYKTCGTWGAASNGLFFKHFLLSKLLTTNDKTLAIAAALYCMCAIWTSFVNTGVSFVKVCFALSVCLRSGG